ncbi:MAG: alpha/beta hydrolase family protein [Promethearchaeota archaeon]
MKNSPEVYVLEQNTEFNIQSTNGITDFWNLTEIQNIPLNITYGDTKYVWTGDTQKNLTVANIQYTSQYWINNTDLRINGALVFPDNSTKQLGKVPGIVLMHGIGQIHLEMLYFAYFFAILNYTVIIFDFPGHGNSSGPPPTQEWIFPDLSDFDGNITDDLLYRTHFYLISRAAIRAVDVLLNQTEVDSLRIAMIGVSYGGLTTMFASNIYSEKVKSAIPIVASGNLDISFTTPYSMLNLIINTNEVDFSDPSLLKFLQYFDPINYVNSSNNPATCYICGTNDDFFPIETYNNTFYTTQNKTKAMAMTPGGHHGFLMNPLQGVILYWLNHTLWNGPAPPTIQVYKDIESTILGDKLKVTVNISCDAPITKVILATHREILGATWKKKEMDQVNQSTWTAEVKSLPFGAKITYFVLVEIEGIYYTAFSTYVWRDNLSTWLGIPFLILIAFGLAIPIFFLMRYDIKKMKSTMDSSNQRKYLILNVAQLSGIGVSEIFIWICVFFPIAVFLPEANQLKISLETILSEYIDFFPFVAPFIFIFLIAGFILVMSKPILGGIINLIIPILMLIFGLLLFSMIHAISEIEILHISGTLFSFGFGTIFWFILAGMQISFGIFKRKYQKCLRKLPPSSD